MPNKQAHRPWIYSKSSKFAINIALHQMPWGNMHGFLYVGTAITTLSCTLPRWFLRAWFPSKLASRARSLQAIPRPNRCLLILRSSGHCSPVPRIRFDATFQCFYWNLKFCMHWLDSLHLQFLAAYVTLRYLGRFLALVSRNCHTLSWFLSFSRLLSMHKLFWAYQHSCISVTIMCKMIQSCWLHMPL